MKRILLVCMVSTMFVGCASTQQKNQANADNARKSCIASGFKPGTDLFLNCFTTVLNANSQPSLMEQSLRNMALNPQPQRYQEAPWPALPMTTVCHGTGAIRTCTTQ
jgi:hypothetical protein